MQYLFSLRPTRNIDKMLLPKSFFLWLLSNLRKSPIIKIIGDNTLEGLTCRYPKFPIHVPQFNFVLLNDFDTLYLTLKTNKKKL